MAEHISVVEQMLFEFEGANFRASCSVCPWSQNARSERVAYRFARDHFEYFASLQADELVATAARSKREEALR